VLQVLQLLVGSMERQQLYQHSTAVATCGQAVREQQVGCNLMYML